MKKIYVAVFGAMIAAAGIPAARGQSLSFADFDISLSPRVWFRTDNSPAVNRLGPTATISPSSVPGEFVTDIRNSKSLNYPMYGLSATVSPHNFQIMGGATDFVITAFGGSGQANLFHTTVAGANAFLVPPSSTFPFGLQAQSFEESDQAERIDVEALARTALSSNALFVYGLRYIHQRDDYTSFDLTQGIPATFLLRTGNATHIKVSDDTPMAETGFQLSAPISSDGAHRFIAGLTLGAGVTLVSAPGLASPNYFTVLLDTSVGYQYAFNNSLSALIRYRFEALAYARGGSLLDNNLQVIHGPEVGLSVTF